jgi:hypothetical protein
VRSCSSNLRVVVLIRPDEANLAIARGEAVLILAGLAEDPVRPLPRRRVRAAGVRRAGLVTVRRSAAVRWAGLVAVARPTAAVRSAEVRPASTAPVVRPLVAALVRDVDDVAVPAAEAVCWRGGAAVGVGVRAAVVGRGVLAVPASAVQLRVGVRAAVVGRRVLTVPASAVRRGIGVGAAVVGRRVLAVPASAVRGGGRRRRGGGLGRGGAGSPWLANGSEPDRRGEWRLNGPGPMGVSERETVNPRGTHALNAMRASRSGGENRGQRLGSDLGARSPDAIMRCTPAHT